MTVDDPAAVCTGGAKRNPYAEAAPELYRLGLFPIPCGGEDGKSPTGIKRWQSMKRPPLHVIERLAAKHASCNVGVVMGRSSGCTVVDVDAPEIVGKVIDRCGDTPLITRTPSGGAHLWYRYAGEGCPNIRQVLGWDADLKGQGGQVIVPPSFNRTSLRPYQFERGSWNDLRRLPRIRSGAWDVEGRVVQAPGNVVRVATIPQGQRDNLLFKFLLREAYRQNVMDRDELLKLANEFNASCNPPQTDAEVWKTTNSAWSIHCTGNNRNGKEQRVYLLRREVKMLAANPEALVLLAELRGAHPEPNKRFAVSPKAMAKADVLPGWGVDRYRRARDELVRAGFMPRVRTGGRGAHDPHQYELALPAANPEGLRNPTQYNVTPRTASPLPSPVGLGELAATGTTASANNDFAALLRQERKRRGLRQADVARAAGLSRPALANIEVGRFGASPQARERLLAALGVAA